MEPFETAHDRANREAREFVKAHGRRNGLKWDRANDRLKVGPRFSNGESSGEQVVWPQSRGKKDPLLGIDLRRLPLKARKVGSIVRYGIKPKPKDKKKIHPVTLLHEEWLVASAYNLLPGRGKFADVPVGSLAYQRLSSWSNDSDDPGAEGFSVATFHSPLSRPKVAGRAPVWIDGRHRRNSDNIDVFLVRGGGLLDRARRRYEASGSSEGLRGPLLEFLQADLQGSDVRGLLTLAAFDAIGILRGFRPSAAEIDRCLSLMAGLIDYLGTGCNHNFRRVGDEKMCAWCGLIISAEADVPDAYCIVCGREIEASVFGPPPAFCPKRPKCRADFSRANRSGGPEPVARDVTSGGG